MENNMNEKMTASESVYGFAGWLTSRAGTVTLGAKHDAAIAAELAKKWCDANGLDDPRIGVYPDNIVKPSR